MSWRRACNIAVDTPTAGSILCGLCAELPFAGWLPVPRVGAIMLAEDRASANLDSRQATTISIHRPVAAVIEMGVHVRRQESGARRCFVGLTFMRMRTAAVTYVRHT